MNPLPTNVLKDLGINRIIAVNVLQSPEHSARGHQMELRHYEEMKRVPFLKSPVQYISTRLGRLFSLNLADIIVRTLQATEYVIAEQNAKLADVFIHPNLEGINWYELYRVDDLIKAGEEATYKALPRINALIKNNS
ncbi:MAG: hypothetical protein A2Z88_09230 [Omnitrophica WOR_2 bacterium GWA2_47_8]|nr:MAG: hypothetical protein A2Z88_09230 [Omnitrophica WOR_2 bacterium GWA2_47_8]